MSVATVLLVEDDISFADMVQRSLRAHGYTVVAVDTVREAERRLNGGLRPGVVLLDINLPEESGWALLRGRSLTDAGSPPVIVVSAMTLSSRRLRQYGVAGSLPKPFSLETFLGVVERAVNPDRSGDE